MKSFSSYVQINTRSYSVQKAYYTERKESEYRYFEGNVHEYKYNIYIGTQNKINIYF